MNIEKSLGGNNILMVLAGFELNLVDPCLAKRKYVHMNKIIQHIVSTLRQGLIQL